MGRVSTRPTPPALNLWPRGGGLWRAHGGLGVEGLGINWPSTQSGLDFHSLSPCCNQIPPLLSNGFLGSQWIPPPWGWGRVPLSPQATPIKRMPPFLSRGRWAADLYVTSNVNLGGSPLFWWDSKGHSKETRTLPILGSAQIAGAQHPHKPSNLWFPLRGPKQRFIPFLIPYSSHQQEKRTKGPS